MKIAILSDAHDHVENTRTAVKLAQEKGAEVLIFAGDFCAPRAALNLGEFKGDIYAIFGNNDGDQLNIYQVAHSVRPDMKFYLEARASFEIDGKKIFVTHYPVYANALARTGDYDLVCFGHDHQARIEVHGNCLAVNPGCLNPVRSDDIVGFAIYDTATHQAELFPI
jgi:putative phosphoesterase